MRLRISLYIHTYIYIYIYIYIFIYIYIHIKESLKENRTRELMICQEMSRLLYLGLPVLSRMRCECYYRAP